MITFCLLKDIYVILLKDIYLFFLEKRQTRLPYIDMIINKSGTTIWMGIYNKPTDSKRYVPFTSNHPRDCLTNITFSLAWIIFTIAENENVKAK